MNGSRCVYMNPLYFPSVDNDDNDGNVDSITLNLLSMMWNFGRRQILKIFRENVFASLEFHLNKTECACCALEEKQKNVPNSFSQKASISLKCCAFEPCSCFFLVFSCTLRWNSWKRKWKPHRESTNLCAFCHMDMFISGNANNMNCGKSAAQHIAYTWMDFVGDTRHNSQTLSGKCRSLWKWIVAFVPSFIFLIQSRIAWCCPFLCAFLRRFLCVCSLSKCVCIGTSECQSKRINLNLDKYNLWAENDCQLFVDCVPLIIPSVVLVTLFPSLHGSVAVCR